MFRELIEKTASELNKRRILYMIIGGQAVLLYGEPRLTKDIDIALGIGVDRLGEVRKIVQKLALKILVDSPENFVRKTMVLPVIDEKTGIRIDFIFSFSPYEKQAIERAVGIKFGKTQVRFASREDVVIHKIIAGRARDIEDVKAVLLKNPNYDSKYIQEWLKEFDKSLDRSFSDTFKKIAREVKKDS